VRQMIRQGAWEDEQGFTLVEVMVVVIMMGIVFAIASSTWFNVVEGRQVDSATNQVAADLRLAHSRATNKLADYNFVAPSTTLPAGVDPLSTYQTGPTGTLVLNRLPDGTQIAAATTIVFKADGSAQITGANPITVRSSSDTSINHTIEINTTTSRIQVVP
jgi:prepilin-type N-terminal cleavage/methylation domain-containing protein